MNFVEKIIYCYKYMFYKEYTCFNCGVDFRMKKLENDEESIPVCGYSCMITGCIERDDKIKEFRYKYGKNWRMEYTKYIKEI